MNTVKGLITWVHRDYVNDFAQKKLSLFFLSLSFWYWVDREVAVRTVEKTFLMMLEIIKFSRSLWERIKTFINYQQNSFDTKISSNKKTCFKQIYAEKFRYFPVFFSSSAVVFWWNWKFEGLNSQVDLRKMSFT